MIVRNASSGDFSEIASLWHRSAASMDGGVVDMPTVAALRDRIDEELAKGWQLIIACENETITGFLAIIPSVSVLDQIFVSPDFQAKSIGTALLHTAMRRMPSGFTLRMSKANQRAGRFYERNGLVLLSEGQHPRTDAPVRYYRWEGISPR